jgi:hypothetical protein
MELTSVEGKFADFPMDPHHAFDLASSYGSYSMLAYHDVQQT